jgi:hypothetical protein
MRSRNVLEEIIRERKNNEVSMADINGEPYFEETFAKATLMYKDSIKIGEPLIRYHAFADEMEISNSESIGILQKADYLRVHLDDDVYRPLNYIAGDGDIRKGYFIEEMAGEKASLFLRKYKTLKQGKEAQTSFHQATPPEFISHEDYYLKFGNNSPEKVKLTRKSILKSFPKHTDKLKKFYKNENVDINTEAGLKRLIAHYNSLD